MWCSTVPNTVIDPTTRLATNCSDCVQNVATPYKGGLGAPWCNIFRVPLDFEYLYVLFREYFQNCKLVQPRACGIIECKSKNRIQNKFGLLNQLVGKLYPTQIMTREQNPI